MEEFGKYEAMKAAAIDPAQAYRAAKEDGLGQIVGIRMLREIYELSLIEAKEVVNKVDTGEAVENRQSGLEKEFTDILDEFFDG
jgi:ribosomal protein L7/L12